MVTASRDPVPREKRPGRVALLRGRRKGEYRLMRIVGEAGIEPTTPGLEGRCSIQLSYSPVSAIVSSSTATSKLDPASMHHYRQGQIERLTPPLLGAGRGRDRSPRRTRSLQNPAHPRPPHAAVRVPPAQPSPGSPRSLSVTARIHRSHCLGRRSTRGPRAAAGRCKSRRQRPFPRVRRPSRRDRRAHRPDPHCWSRHRTLPSREATNHRSAGATRTATRVCVRASSISSIKSESRRRSTNLHLRASGVNPGNRDHRIVGRKLNGPIGFHQGLVTESRKSSSIFSAQ